MDKKTYERINNYVMGAIYAPLLLITAYLETSQAHLVVENRRKGQNDDDTVEEWEHTWPRGQSLDFEADGWTKRVESTKPNVETDAAVLEIRDLKGKISELAKMIEGLKEKSVGESA